MRLEILANHRTRGPNRMMSHENNRETKRVLYEYFSSSSSTRYSHKERDSDKEKLSVFAVLLAACALSLRRYLERAILPRVDFLTFSSSKAERDAALWKKRFFTKRNEKKVVFCWKKKILLLLVFLVVVHRDVLKKEQIRGSKLELGRVWNDDV